MFKKLNLSIKDVIVDPLLYRGKVKGNYGGVFIEYAMINGKECLNKIQEVVTFDIMPDDINITEIKLSGPKPHTDNPPTVLNFYFKVGGDSTVFFDELHSDNLKPVLRSYTRESLKEVARFVAQPYDVYLLNTHKIHMVEVSNKNADRSMIRLMWMHKTFEEVLQGIKVKTPR